MHVACHGVGDQTEDVHAFVDGFLRPVRCIGGGEGLLGERERSLFCDLYFPRVVDWWRVLAELAGEVFVDDVFHHAQYVEAELVHHLDDDVFGVELFETLEDLFFGRQVDTA